MKQRRAANVGNPVSVIAGNKIETVTDFQAATPSRLSFSRTYDSSGGEFESDYLGEHWRTNFDGRLVKYSGTPRRIDIIRSGGRSASFILADGAWKPAYWNSVTRRYAQPRTDVDWTLTYDSATDNWAFTDEDDTVEIYDDNNGRVRTITYGRVQTITYRDGYRLTFGHDADGRNTTITDSYNKQLTFTYETSGRLATMTTPDGKVFKYTYVYRNLGVVDDPDQKFGYILGKVIEPDNTPADDTDNPFTQYHYENTTFRSALTGITDRRGVRYATWEYDNQGRVTVSKHAGDTDKTTIAYDDVNNTRTITNPLGKKAIYRLGLFQGRLRINQIDGQVSTNCPASNSAYTYDTNGFLATRTDEEARITAHTNNARGLPTTVVRGSGTPEAVTTTYTYHATLNVPTQMVEPGKTTNYTWNASGQLASIQYLDTTTHALPYSTSG